jgi:hypothetical protein
MLAFEVLIQRWRGGPGVAREGGYDYMIRKMVGSGILLFDVVENGEKLKDAAYSSC